MALHSSIRVKRDNAKAHNGILMFYLKVPEVMSGHIPLVKTCHMTKLNQ